MDGLSLRPEQEKIKALKTILPEVFSEDKIDWEKLKATLGEHINFSNERYVLNWAGKSDAFKILQTPTSKTLVPAKEESVNFDETQNIFIEGENLEVLKVLQKSYFGKVKMIYIDPPYNTGNDSFIYPDKFSESKADYEKRVGDKDEEGYITKDGMFKKNSKENGQYHSNWLNMMMPRLYLAKNLLRQDGVIFVSIDDNEVHNLRLLMNEIFGEENFVAKFIHKNNSSKNQSKLVSVSTEYFYCFAKNISELNKYTWRIEKKGASDIAKMFNKLQDAGLSLDEIDLEIKEMYKRPKYSHLSRWNKVDEKGVFKDADLSREGGPKDYTIINPSTGKECIIPNRGWGKSLDELLRLQSENLIWYGDENTPPGQKDYITNDDVSVPDNFWYYDNSVDTRDIKKMFGTLVFENPKPKAMVKNILNLHFSSKDIILDFFAGSGTTAHSVMDLNKEDGGNRKYICVQLPELCEEKSEAYKAGYKTIAEISKERIRRAGKKIREEINAEINKIEAQIKKLQGELPTAETKTEIEKLKGKIVNLEAQDLGFKVLKLEDSNFKQWKQIEGKDAKALAEQMKLFVDPIADHATIENMVYELLLKSGKDLNSTIEKNDGYFLINGNEMALILEKVSQEIIDAVITEKPIKVIALDKLFKGNDQLKTNTVLQMRDAGVEFKTI